MSFHGRKVLITIMIWKEMVINVRSVIYNTPDVQDTQFPLTYMKLADLLKVLGDCPASEEETFQAIELITDTQIAVDFFSNAPKKYVVAEPVVFRKLDRMLLKRSRETSVSTSLEVLKELYRMEDMGVPINAEMLSHEAVRLSEVCTESVADLISQAERNQMIVSEADVRGNKFSFPEECIDLNAYLQVVRKNIKHANMLKPDKLSKYVFQDQYGRSRLRTHWDIFGALSGRIQSSDFNVQGLPKGIRQTCIQPAEGYSLVCVDYVSEELILIALLSDDVAVLDSVMKQADLHKRIASIIFDKAEALVTKEERSLAKAVDFAYLYGAGDATLQRIIAENWSEAGITVAKVKAAIQKVFTRVASTIKGVEEQGYVELIDKTRISLEDIPKKHTYFNRMVQGSGAVILKKVVSEIAKQLPEGAYICFLLHDELMVETPSYLTQVCVDVVTKSMTEVLHGYGYSIDLPISIEIKEGGK